MTMNAFELKELLEQYKDEELQAMKIYVLCNADYEEENLVIADSFEVDSDSMELIINI